MIGRDCELSGWPGISSAAKSVGGWGPGEGGSDILCVRWDFGLVYICAVQSVSRIELPYLNDT